jgi:CheY-like chemotaxis protein
MTNILVVDDHLEIQKLFKSFFEKKGHQVMCASTGKEALEQMKRGPAAVLLDIMLPDVQGLQVLNRMREMAPSTPVIVLTGVAEPDIGLKAVQRGAVDFITKPASLKHLLSLIEYYVLQGNVKGHA